MPTAEGTRLETEVQGVIFKYRQGGLTRADTIRRLFLLVHDRLIVVLKIFGVMDVQYQDDLVQEVMCRLLRFLDSYDSARPLLPWLDQIARNVRADHLKRARTERTICSSLHGDTSEDDDVVLTEIATPTDQADVIIRSIDTRMLLCQLPENDRLLLLYRYFDGYSIPELALVYAASERTIKYWIAEAIRRLSELVNGNRRDPPRGGPPVVGSSQLRVSLGSNKTNTGAVERRTSQSGEQNS